MIVEVYYVVEVEWVDDENWMGGEQMSFWMGIAVVEVVDGD